MASLTHSIRAVFEGFSEVSIWNDQPPLLTLLTAALFAGLAPDVFWARFLAVFFTLALIVGMIGVCLASLGKDMDEVPAGLRRLVASAIAISLIVLYLGNAVVLELSVSAMLEVPAFALGIWALLLICCHTRWSCSAFFLVAAGTCLGLALATKLTAVLVLPAAVVELLFGSRWHRDECGSLQQTTRTSFSAGWRNWKCSQRLMALSAFLGTASGIAACLFFLTDTPVYSSLLKTHFDPQIHETASLDEGLTFQFSFLLKDPTVLLAGLAGLVAGVALGYRSAVQTAAVLLATMCVVHSNHGPWWYYYILHFYIPLACLGATGIGIALAKLLHHATGVRPWGAFAKGSAVFGALLVLMSLVGSRISDIAVSILRLGEARRTADMAIIGEINRNRNRTKWMFADEMLLPFYCNLAVPPELAVLPRKRFWAGLINVKSLILILERYQPEQLVLAPGDRSTELTQWIEANYDLTYQDFEHVVYLRKTLSNDGDVHR